MAGFLHDWLRIVVFLKYFPDDSLCLVYTLFLFVCSFAFGSFFFGLLMDQKECGSDLFLTDYVYRAWGHIASLKSKKVVNVFVYGCSVLITSICLPSK
jgi:hypothetical protein